MTPHYVSKPRVDKVLRDVLMAHHVIRFYYYPNSKLNQNVKTYEYRKLVERLILVVFGSCPQIVFDRPKNYNVDTWAKFIRHSRFLNRRFVELEESRVKLFFELAEICFDAYPNKKINAVLELFEHSQLYGASTGLRNSMFVTILESFFVAEHDGVKTKFANRLSDYFRTKMYDFQYFKKLYEARSEFYHQGICEFDKLKEYELMELTQELIFENIKKMK